MIDKVWLLSKMDNALSTSANALSQDGNTMKMTDSEYSVFGGETKTRKYATQSINSLFQSRPFCTWYEWLARPTLPKGMSVEEYFSTAGLLNACVELDIRALEDAMAYLRELPYGMRISVNVSEHSIDDPTFHHRALQLLTSVHSEPDQLVLEIRPFSTCSGFAKTVQFLQHMTQLGVTLALDSITRIDSSMRSICPFHLFQYIKINHRLVVDSANSVAHRKRLAELFMVGRGLGLEVVATGVESLALLELVREGGAQFYQGHIDGLPETITMQQPRGSYAHEYQEAAV